MLALSVVGDAVPPRERGKIQGVFAAVFSVSSVLGPLAGGWLSENANWHWIFFINIPLGLIALVGFAASFKPRGIRTKPQDRLVGRRHPDPRPRRLDPADQPRRTQFCLGIGQLLWHWRALTVLSFIAFVLIERRAEEPILPLWLFKMNVFWVTSVIGLHRRGGDVRRASPFCRCTCKSPRARRPPVRACC